MIDIDVHTNEGLIRHCLSDPPLHWLLFSHYIQEVPPPNVIELGKSEK